MNRSLQDTVSTIPYDAGTTRTLGTYELLIPLGAGGMASVWLARRKGTRGFQKLVAVKFLHARLQKSGSHERMFLDEARIAARIHHPNVAEIYDLGDHDGLLYQVMEWVDGEPLSALLKVCQGKLPIPIAVEIGIQVAAGLHAAHQLRDDDGEPLGLVHRDVSPQNILIGFDGTVKVVDFGVAKATCNAEKTAIGQIKGKVSYMSPEQANGHPVDRRTDIFVLGVVLYLMLTGRHPFRGETETDTIRRLTDARFVAKFSEDCPDLPPALWDVLREAIHKDSFERCANMADLMRALEAALPPSDRITSEELGAFLRSHLGDVRLHRREALREALRARGEGWSVRSLPPASVPTVVEPRSLSGRPQSNTALIVTASRPNLLSDGRAAASTILIASITSILGGAVGFLASRWVSPAVPVAPHTPSLYIGKAEAVKPPAQGVKDFAITEASARSPRKPLPCDAMAPARERTK